MTLLEYAIAAYAHFCLRVFILAGEALGDAVLYLAGFMPGYNDHQRVTSLVIVLYATATAWAHLLPVLKTPRSSRPADVQARMDALAESIAKETT